MDIRENVEDPEEVIRACFAGLMKSMFTIMPARVTSDTANGHVATVQPTIQRQTIDPETGKVSYAPYPLHTDVPIHHVGGGAVATTYPNKADDEGALLYAARAIDSWFQSGGTQQPIDHRMHSLADAFFLSGIRSVPRKLQQVDKDAAQIRSEDKRHVISHHPETGTHVKSVDPSTAQASPSFDPFTQATKFFEHFVHPSLGLLGNATSGGVTHSHGVGHDQGAFMRALNGLHSVLAHPENGASLNAANLLHQVMAHPSLGALLSAAGGKHMVQAHPENGVAISSSAGIALKTPSLSLPAGSIKAAALDSNAAASSVGNLGGDLSGTLPNPQVMSIANVTGLDKLPNAANDAAAAALGVKVGSAYRNGSQLMARIA